MTKTKAEEMAKEFASNHSELIPITGPRWTNADLDSAIEKASNSGFLASAAWLLQEAEKMAIKPHPNSVTQFEPFVNLCDLKKLLGEV